MNRFTIAVVALIATAAAAQAPAGKPATPAADPTQVAVAVINSEVITRAKLDALYANLNPQLRTQYDRNGGKSAFLDNYLRKRLFIQEAMKSGFDQKPEVLLAMETAREGALFDRYVRDVVAANFVSDDDVRKYYDEHRSEFGTPEQRKLAHIILLTSGAQGMAKAEAAQRIQELAQDLRESIARSGASDPAALAKTTFTLFQQAARKVSQDGSAQQGGELGWVDRGSLDQRFAEAAWATQPGKISPVVESAYGYHLIYVEDTKPDGTKPFEEVRNDIRERLLADHTTDIMNAVTQMTNQLKASGKVSVSPENIK